MRATSIDCPAVAKLRAWRREVSRRRLWLAASLLGGLVAFTLAPRPVAAQAAVHRPIPPPVVRERAARCEVTPSGPPNATTPLIVTVGASFTAGVGAGNPARNWSVRLAQLLDWRSVTLGVPGAGYVKAGLDGLGPLRRELGLVDLSTLGPSLVIVQAGHDDWRVSGPVEARAVKALIEQVRSAAPFAALAVLTVFARPGASAVVMARDERIDAAIVAAVRTTDPFAVIVDPLRDHWRFPRADGGLHPSAAGHLLIAKRVASALYTAGVIPKPRATTAIERVSCQFLGHAAPLRPAAATIVARGRT